MTERKVDLPARWVKGFGEVQALARQMRLAASLDAAEASRFIGSLPRAARRPCRPRSPAWPAPGTAPSWPRPPAA